MVSHRVVGKQASIYVNRLEPCLDLGLKGTKRVARLKSGQGLISGISALNTLVYSNGAPICRYLQ